MVEEVSIELGDLFLVEGHGILVLQLPGVARLLQVEEMYREAAVVQHVTCHLLLLQDTLVQLFPRVDAQRQVNAGADDSQRLHDG